MPNLPPLQKRAAPARPQRPIQQAPVQQAQYQQQQQYAYQQPVQEQPQEPEKDSSRQNTSFMTNRFLYWSGLLFLTVMNFVITLILIPLVLLLKGAAVYIIVLVFGLLFGVIFDFLIRDIEHMEKKHHLFAALMVPLISIIDLFLIQTVARSISVILKVSIAQNPLVAGSVYLLGFLAPFTYSYLIKQDIE